MYTQPITRRMRVPRLLAVLALVGVLVGALMVVHAGAPDVNRASVAATAPKIISGHVYLLGGTTPAVEAIVIATVWDGLSLRGTSFPVTSDSSGFYTLTLGLSDWDVGNQIVVTASIDTAIGEGNIVADASYEQNVNIVMGTEVPEFGAPVVLLLASIAAIAVVMGRARTRRM